MQIKISFKFLNFLRIHRVVKTPTYACFPLVLRWNIRKTYITLQLESIKCWFNEKKKCCRNRTLSNFFCVYTNAEVYLSEHGRFIEDSSYHKVRCCNCSYTFHIWNRQCKDTLILIDWKKGFLRWLESIYTFVNTYMTVKYIWFSQIKEKMPFSPILFYFLFLFLHMKNNPVFMGTHKKRLVIFTRKVKKWSRLSNDPFSKVS